MIIFLCFNHLLLGWVLQANLYGITWFGGHMLIEKVMAASRVEHLYSIEKSV